MTGPIASAEHALDLVQGAEAEGRLLLYHSGTQDQAASIAENGVTAGVGDWVQEIAASASDDFDVAATSVPVSYFSPRPDWVAIKVAKKLGISLRDVRLEHVREHGHLAIIDAEDARFYRVPENGYDGQWVETLEGRRLEIWNTNLHSYDDLNALNLEPFGLEPGDIVTADEYVNVLASLSGDELVVFMKIRCPEQIALLEKGPATRSLR